MKPTLAVPIAVLAFTALSAMLIKRARRPGVTKGETAPDELAAAAG